MELEVVLPVCHLAISFPLQIGDYVAHIDMPANSVETIMVKF